MAAANKFNSTVDVFARGGINLAVDNLKMMLTSVLPVATNSVYGDVSPTELPAGNGYVTGGFTAPFVSSGQVAGLYKLVLSSPTWIASGPMGPFQYAILYDSTNISIANKPLIGWWALPAPLLLVPTQSFTVALSPATGIVQMQ
jgi:hypothetical protein